MQSKTSRIKFLCGVSLTLWVAPKIAQAQAVDSAAPAQAGSSTADSSVSLEEIVITAQRRKENLQSVPVTVTALAAQPLVAAGVSGTADLANVVSGLTMPQSQGTPQPHIRGVGNTAIGTGIENSVALYVDGVYHGSASFSAMSLNNIAQIEVEKGPQGTLYGRNSTGGLMQVTTQDPRPDFSGSAHVGYGSYDTTTQDLYLTGGSNIIAGDFAFQSSQQGTGWGKNLYNGQDVNKETLDLSARSKWIITPGEDTNIKVIFDYGKNNSSIGALGNYRNGANTFYPKGITPTSTFDVDTNQQPYRFKQGGGASVQVTQDLGFASLQDTVAYRQDSVSSGFDVDLGPSPTLAIITSSVDSQFTEELQLLSQRNSSWKWVAGVFFYHAINANDPGTTAFGGAAVSPTTGVTSVSNYASEGTVSTAGYAQVTKEVLPNTDLTLGIRDTAETRAISGYSTRVTTFPTPIAPTSVVPASRSTNTPTWRVALDHKFSDTVMAYISDSRGFKSGGYNLSNGNTPYAPEKLDAYEIGLKTELYEHRVTLNSSAFYYDYRNIQVSRYVNGAALIYNGAAATAFGMDIDVTAALSKRLILRAGVELIRDYFTSFKNADFFLTCPSGPTSVCSLSAVGKALPQTSAASGTINLDYLVPLPDDAGLNFDLNAAINSGYYFAPNNEDHQSGYGLLNGSIRWFSAGNRYEARLWGKNLTNEIYYLSVNQSPGSTAASFAAPRTVGISLGMKF